MKKAFSEKNQEIFRIFTVERLTIAKMVVISENHKNTTISTISPKKHCFQWKFFKVCVFAHLFIFDRKQENLSSNFLLYKVT